MWGNCVSPYNLDCVFFLICWGKLKQPYWARYFLHAKCRIDYSQVDIFQQYALIHPQHYGVIYLQIMWNKSNQCLNTEKEMDQLSAHSQPNAVSVSERRKEKITEGGLGAHHTRILNKSFCLTEKWQCNMKSIFTLTELCYNVDVKDQILEFVKHPIYQSCRGIYWKYICIVFP